MLLTTPESLALLLSYADADEIFGRPAAASSSTSCMRWPATSAAICWRLGLARLRGWRPAAAASASPRRWPTSELADWLAAEPGTGVDRAGARRRAAEIDILETPANICPGPAIWRCMPCAEIYAQIKAAQHDPGLRQHPRPGGADLPGAVAHQRRQSARSRSITASLAPEQRRKVEAAMARGQAAGRRRHLLAGSGRGLGRGRSGDPGRRAQGRQPPDPAHRPRQSPPRRAEPRAAGAGQPLRGAGMPRPPCEAVDGRTRWTASTAARRARCAGPASPGHGLLRSFRGRGDVSRGDRRRALSRSAARDFDAVLDFVATGGYALAAYERWHRLKRNEDGRWASTIPGCAAAIA